MGDFSNVDLLNGLDLFSGIGGISQALAPWVRTIAYCERERYAQAVLLSRMERGEIETAPIWDDVTTLTAEHLPRIDFISGGFPCQDLSVAGLRAGLAGKRSGLFFEIIRLTRELQPRFVFLENVAGIFAGDTLGTVGGALASVGYDCRWGVLSAYDVGAPHIRERWFALAHAKKNDGSNGRKAKRRNIPKKNRKIGSSEFGGRIGWAAEPGVCRVDDGLPNHRYRLECLGNGVVPQQVEEAFKRLAGLDFKGNQ